MAVTHFIPGGFTDSRRGKLRAIPTTREGAGARPTPVTVTMARTGRVGAPTGNPVPSGAGGALVAEAVATGFEGLTALEQRTAQVAREFRRGRRESGLRGLAVLVQGLDAIVGLATTAADSLGEDLDLHFDESGLGASEITRRVVLELAADQATGDYAALADTLERRLIPALTAWRAVFESLGGSSDPGPFGDAA